MSEENRLLLNELFKLEDVKNIKQARTHCDDLFQSFSHHPNKSIEEAIQSVGDISDISTCAANTIATGPGITTANPGRKATFTITSRDSQNFQRKLGGDVFEVKLKPAEEEDEIKVDLNDQKDGTYSAEYTVDEMYGELTLSVFLRGVHIKGSPFAVNVEPRIRPLSPLPRGIIKTNRYLNK